MNRPNFSNRPDLQDPSKATNKLNLPFIPLRKAGGPSATNNTEDLVKKPLGIDFGAKFGMLKKVAPIVTADAKPLPQPSDLVISQQKEVVPNVQ